MEEKVFTNEYVSTINDTSYTVVDDIVSAVKEPEEGTFESAMYEVEKLESKIKDLRIENEDLFDQLEKINTDICYLDIEVDRLLEARYKLDDKINKLEYETNFIYKWLIFGICIAFIPLTMAISILCKISGI